VALAGMQAAYTPFKSALRDVSHMAHALYEVISIGVVSELCEVEAYIACRYAGESVLQYV
jgi:hypothetical protein